MIVLGFNGGAKSSEEDDNNYFILHDSAAALMKDGELVAAVEEERLNRMKHTSCFPSSAIRYCMENAGVSWDDIDCIVKVSDEKRLASKAQSEALMDTTIPVPSDARAFVASSFEREFGVNVSCKLRFCDHHEAHLWSAFALSGFEEALVISIDGEGDGRSGAISLGRQNTMTQLRHYLIPQSLGNLYTGIIRLLGFGFFDEYKAMGLAPYGDPTVYQSLFDEGYSLIEDGDYKIDSLAGWAERFAKAGLIQQARRKQAPFQPVHMNLAATLQKMLERILMHVLRTYQLKTGQKNLCMAGGVAHNCTFNGNILRSGLFENVFVQPAAHDAGGALGAACWAIASQSSRVSIRPISHVYLGPCIAADDVVGEQLNAWSSFIKSTHQSNIVEEAAALLAGGAVIGWVQGRSEFGPRALGNRSILADPRPAGNKDLINLMVKKREQFRPFAPSVIEEQAGKVFEIPDCRADLSYMTYVLKVREAYRSLLGAITHVDGTARIQTVSRNNNSLYWELLNEFGKLTGIPVLLNTSFNNNAEPIVDSVDDAVVCFLTTGLHYLVVGNFLVSKRPSFAMDEDNDDANVMDNTDARLTLIPSMPTIRRLVRSDRAGKTIHRIESTQSFVYSRRPEAQISDAMFNILSHSDHSSTMGELLEQSGIRDLCGRRTLVRELLDLWSKRMVALHPKQAGVRHGFGRECLAEVYAR